MKVLFLTLAEVYDLNDHDIYQDLMRYFVAQGHQVYVVTAIQRSMGQQTMLYESCGCHILRVRVGNQSGCSMIEKGISTLMLQNQYWRAVQKHLKGIRFDLLLYATPPITLTPMIKKLKHRYSCGTFLMLKDIFPQNAVDLGMFRNGGMIHRYFRRQEQKLYDVSDHIGCMSPANIAYICEHNPAYREKVTLCPNALQAYEPVSLSSDQIRNLKAKYGIPEAERVLVYGGNLGRPQGISFLKDCLAATKDRTDVFFLIIGSGTEFASLKAFLDSRKIRNAKLVGHLPRDTYFELMSTADVGMIFLDHRFTIPNFPSRILPYMENKMPVACVADTATDVGRIAEENHFGWYCRSDSTQEFLRMLDRIVRADIQKMGQKARTYFEQHYTVEECYQKIVERIL